MKKGEMRREAIVKTAERLFFEKGYEETSIQDILDELSISKGGFYHHFDSKIALLAEISRQRTEGDVERVRAQLRAGRMDAVRKLDALLGAMMTLGRGEPRFAALMLKVCYLDGDVQFREQARLQMAEALRPLVNEAIAEGLADGSLFTRHPGKLGELLLALTGDLNDELCRLLAANSGSPDCAVDMMELLDAWREGVELLSGARFGSIALLDMEHMTEEFRQTARELNQLKARA